MKTIPTTPAQAQKAIGIAKEHLGKGNMVDSAELCLDDAMKCLGRGEFEYARLRAAKSVAYSVGVFSPAHNLVMSEEL